MGPIPLIRSACRDLAALLFFGSSGGNLEDVAKKDH